jgi:hypothetical protein
MDDSQHAALVEEYLRKSNAFLEWNEARGFTDPFVDMSAAPKWGVDDHENQAENAAPKRPIK